MIKPSGLKTIGQVACTVLTGTAVLFGAQAAFAESASFPAPPAQFEDAKAAYLQAWDAAGLSFAIATLSENASSGYGDFSARGSSVYSDGAPVYIYAEPVGYAFAETSSGSEYKLTASYKLLNQSGQILAEQENFATFAKASRSKQLELSAGLTFQFSGLPVGNYQIETRFVDEISGDSSTFSLPISISNAN